MPLVSDLMTLPSDKTKAVWVNAVIVQDQARKSMKPTLCAYWIHAAELALFQTLKMFVVCPELWLLQAVAGCCMISM